MRTYSDFASVTRPRYAERRRWCRVRLVVLGWKSGIVGRVGGPRNPSHLFLDLVVTMSASGSPTHNSRGLPFAHVGEGPTVAWGRASVHHLAPPPSKGPASEVRARHKASQGRTRLQSEEPSHPPIVRVGPAPASCVAARDGPATACPHLPCLVDCDCRVAPPLAAGRGALTDVPVEALVCLCLTPSLAPRRQPPGQRPASGTLPCPAPNKICPAADLPCMTLPCTPCGVPLAPGRVSVHPRTDPAPMLVPPA